jgi:hypothetical protein
VSRPQKPLPNVGDLYEPRPGRKPVHSITITAVLKTPDQTFIQARTTQGRNTTMRKKSFDNSYQLKRPARVVPTPPKELTRTADPIMPSNDAPTTNDNPTIPLALILQRLQDISNKLDKALAALGL